MKLSLTLLLAVVLLSASHSFAGPITNGSFESGFTPGWTTIGNSSIETAAFGTGPLDGTNQALLNSGDGTPGTDLSVTVANLETFLNLTSGTLTTIEPTAFQGRAVKQTVTIDNVGDSIYFNWDFVTRDTPPGNSRDFAFFSISSGAGNSGNFLANTNSALSVFAGGGFTAHTGYAPGGFVFSGPGVYTIGFGVVNATDAFLPSGLLVDNVIINAVPEPSVVAGLGLLTMGAVLRRRRR